MSLKTIGDGILDDVGLDRPSIYVGNRNRTARRVVKAIERAGSRIYKAHPWTVLHAERIITIQGSTTQFSLQPDVSGGRGNDFHRFIPQTHWDRTNRWRAHGPLTPDEWQELQSGQISAGIRVRWRVRGVPLPGTKDVNASQVIEIDSTIGTVTTLAFEYISKYWVKIPDIFADPPDPGGGGPSTVMTADTDESIIDEELIEMDALWRLKKSIGQDYGDDRRDAERAIDMAIAQDGGAPNLHLLGSAIHMREWPNIPETGFGS